MAATLCRDESARISKYSQTSVAIPAITSSQRGIAIDEAAIRISPITKASPHHRFQALRDACASAKLASNKAIPEKKACPLTTWYTSPFMMHASRSLSSAHQSYFSSSLNIDDECILALM
ncbi:hypothetical protein [Planctopirus ephydatiae]|uniref:hypothetical protein n=1 Tax=Planctopirus ephydatiae TaxID=2528019 RepID=UPI001FE38A8B|nr:hypothetical protein [Planctopirus ephydatiae]